MKERLQTILQNSRQYNTEDMAREVFGLSREVHYDALVVAPGWKPTKILSETDFVIQTLAAHSYTSGYEVIIGDKRIAWIQCASGGCNLIDHLALCADLAYDQLLFVGAVGGLKAGFPVGTVCTPSACISGSLAEAYLTEDPAAWRPFEEVRPNSPDYVDEICRLADFPIQRARVFCTDSIICEYSHLPFIHSFDPDLIEMETSSFYRMAALLEKPAAAILVVSDNSASGEPLVGMEEEQSAAFNRGRRVLLPRLLEKIVNR